VSYLKDLAGELSAVGIRGRLRRRILAEIEDHLTCDPQAHLGPPRDLARQFADELGTARACRAGQAAFAGLAVAGGATVVAALAWQVNGSSLYRLQDVSATLTDLGLVLLVVGSQVAFVAGLLGLIRARHHRRDVALSREEAVVIGRRAATGLAAGFACLAGLALLAVEYQRGPPGWWGTLALCAAALGACALAAATPAAVRAARLRPVTAGDRGDLFQDIGLVTPPLLRDRHWVFALMVAGALGLAVTLAGAARADPFDGALRGMAEALACLTGFVVLGRYLGLLPDRSD
jgi:hypothetical protein